MLKDVHCTLLATFENASFLDSQQSRHLLATCETQLNISVHTLVQKNKPKMRLKASMEAPKIPLALSRKNFSNALIKNLEDGFNKLIICPNLELNRQRPKIQNNIVKILTLIIVLSRKTIYIIFYKKFAEITDCTRAMLQSSLT